jgi:hypothetical protein
MNWLDLFDDNAEADRKYHRELARCEASEPCEDDEESTAVLVTAVPEESFKHTTRTDQATIDHMIQQAFVTGGYVLYTS